MASLCLDEAGYHLIHGRALRVLEHELGRGALWALGVGLGGCSLAVLFRRSFLFGGDCLTICLLHSYFVIELE